MYKILRPQVTVSSAPRAGQGLRERSVLACGLGFSETKSYLKGVVKTQVQLITAKLLLGQLYQFFPKKSPNGFLCKHPSF